MELANLKAYYTLTKPGIVKGNLLAALAGYLFASAWHINWLVLLTTLTGTGLVIASSCVVNNYIDRDIDARMERTSSRALVSGQISIRNALLYAAALAVLGFSLLIAWTNWLVVAAGAAGMFSYLVIYGWGKRHTVYGTLLGTISGATPLLAGYVAVSQRIDVNALLLALIMVAWQMPHFYAIAMYREKDYRAAGLPMLPIVKGAHRAKVEVLSYITLFILATSALSIWGGAGAIFALVMLPLSIYWAWGAFCQYDTDAQWGRQMFGQSLVVLLVFCALVSVASRVA